MKKSWLAIVLLLALVPRAWAQGPPAATPVLKEREIQRILGYLRFKDAGHAAIFGSHYSFFLDASDEARLVQAGYAPDVVKDISARGRYLSPPGRRPLLGQTIAAPSASLLVGKGGGPMVSWELRRFTNVFDDYDEWLMLHLINQSGRIIRINSLEVYDAENVSSICLGERVYTRRWNLRTRFGGEVSSFHGGSLVAHPGKVDRSLWENWSDNNKFVGTSTVFTQKKIPNAPNPASLLKGGDYSNVFNIQHSDALFPEGKAMNFKFRYKFSYMSNDGVMRPGTDEGSHEGRAKGESKGGFGVTFSADRDEESASKEELVEHPFWSKSKHETPVASLFEVKVMGEPAHQFRFTEEDARGFFISAIVFDYHGPGEYAFGPDEKNSFHLVTRAQSSDSYRTRAKNPVKGQKLLLTQEQRREIYAEAKGTLTIQAVTDTRVRGAFKAHAIRNSLAGARSYASSNGGAGGLGLDVPQKSRHATVDVAGSFAAQVITKEIRQERAKKFVPRKRIPLR